MNRQSPRLGVARLKTIVNRKMYWRYTMAQDKNLSITIHDFSDPAGEGCRVRVHPNNGDVEIDIDTPRGLTIFMRTATARELNRRLTAFFASDEMAGIE